MLTIQNVYVYNIDNVIHYDTMYVVYKSLVKNTIMFSYLRVRLTDWDPVRPTLGTRWRHYTWNRTQLRICRIFGSCASNNKDISQSSPLVFVILITHRIIYRIVHHFLFHFHDFTLSLKVHHYLLDLRQFELGRRIHILITTPIHACVVTCESS